MTPTDKALRITFHGLLMTLCILSTAGAATFHVDQRHPAASAAGDGTQDLPWKSVSQAARSVKPGDTVIVRRGIYREGVKLTTPGTQEAPITFEAARNGEGEYEEVVLCGADVVTGWQKDRDHWKFAPWTRRFLTYAKGWVFRREQVIVDGQLLKHVEKLDDLAPGCFWVEEQEGKPQALHVRLADDVDPNQHVVEVSVRHPLLAIESDHVRVRGFVLRYAANRAQWGVLTLKGSHNLIEDCTIEWTNGNGVSIGGSNNLLRRVVSRHNGQMGMGGGGVDNRLEDCEVSGNNWKGYSVGWEAGGIKVCCAQNMQIVRMKALRNHGPGIWFDIDDRGGAIRNCYLADNTSCGIFIEISRDTEITDNLCVRNGGKWGFKKDWWAGGITLAESKDCLVAHNTCVLNRHGIGMREMDPREFKGIGREPVVYSTHGHRIHHNILALNGCQFAYWADNPYFGKHPSERFEGEWKRTPLDPRKMSLRIDHNLYHAGRKKAMVLWGVNWRKRHESYVFKSPEENGLSSFSKRWGHESHAVVADPLFVDADAGDFRLRSDSPAVAAGAGLRSPVPGLREVICRGGTKKQK